VNKTEPDSVKAAQLLKMLADAMAQPTYRERLILLAKDAWSRYQACIAAGFSPDQALEIVIRKGIE
jgi:hypothetical protein